MLKLTVVSAMLAVGSLFAGELVRNGDFEQGKTDEVPADWSAAPKTWHWVIDDGVSGSDSIQLNLTGPSSAEARQKIRCKGGTGYTLTAYLKGDGALPFVKVLDGEGKPLAVLKADPKSNLTWKEYSADFRTSARTQELTVVIGAEGSGKRANVDSVSILPQGMKKARTGPALFTPPAGTVNLALNRRYTLIPSGNYPRCKDPGDKTQLTDGIYTVGILWLQKSTVGWRSRETAQITIDLGKVQPIRGFLYSTAAGSAGVSWPEAVHVFTSKNKKDWYYIGDLWKRSLEENGGPEPNRYNPYRAASLNMPACGRWVCFLTKFSGSSYVDEIEVFKGDDTLLSGPVPGNKIAASPEDYLNCLQLAKHFRSDADAILAEAKILSADRQKALAEEFAQILADPGKFTRKGNKTFIPMLPLHPAQERIFAKNNVVLNALGYTKPMFWQNCRWDNLSPIAVPPKDSTPEAVVVDMMPGEVRAEAINILNPTDKVLDYKVSVEGLPAGANLDCREVLFMDTKQNEYVASALKQGQGSSVTLKIHPGTSRQIWFSFVKPALKAGLYKATVKAVAEGAPTLEIPLHLAISKVKFPARPRLHVGGWDYLDAGGGYYKAPGNMESTLALLRSIYVDSPCGNPGILPKGAKFDADGHLTNPDSLDYSNWERWLKRWPDARIYKIAFRAKKQFNGEPMGSERFNRMVREYMAAFAKYLRRTGIDLKRVIIELVDEPRSRAYDELFLAWAKPIKAADPGFVLFENPIYADPSKAMPELYEYSDILCPDTIEMIIHGDKYRDFFLDLQRKKGKTLWLYSCSGPARLLDPVYYHRVQKWHCFFMGAEASFYWAFGCGGGQGDSWHAYSQPGIEYSPYYVSPTDTMPAKQSEGIREGVEDYEYLSMLRDRVAELKKAGKSSPDIEAAEKLLAEGPRSVIEHYLKAPDTGKRYWWGKNVTIRWKTPHDRTLMDKIRLQSLRLLEKLQ